MDTLAQLKKGALQGIKSLSLECGLETFPREIFDLADSLEVLNMSNNQLSTLPDDFGRLKNLRILFLSNNLFTEIPRVLSDCCRLSMVGFKNNRIENVAEDALPLSIRWLILTDNKIKLLPKSLGRLKYLQKCMLAGNQLTHIPSEMAECRNLELLRLSANQLTALPTWLFTLPKLTWLAFAGNPLCAKHPACMEPLEEIDWSMLKVEGFLGQGASGVISKATWLQNDHKREVAIKEFKGEMTSDGLPKEEMDINIAIGHHDNLIDVIGKVKNHPDNRDALVLELIPSSFYNLGKPPSFDTCTRDTYDDNYDEPFWKILKMLKGIASAGAHIHQRDIMHGDFYAHNILLNQRGDSLLGDFGGASYYGAQESQIKRALQKLEVRAFGCLLEEMLQISKRDDFAAHEQSLKVLARLKDACMDKELENRPLFSDICCTLQQIKSLT